MTKRLIIDGQILQTPAFDRGMGKYTLSLLRAFLKKQNKYQSIEIMLSKNLNDTSDRVEYIKEFVGTNKVIFLDLPTDISSELQSKYKTARKLITEYIDKSFRDGDELDFLITSPFFVGFPAVFPSQENVGKYSIIYDIIPQKIWHLLHIFPDDIYFNHYKIFFEADKLLTISEAVKDDLVNIVGVEQEKITSIDGGPFEKLSKNKLNKLELKRPFILYPSAPIVHKNNERAVAAFELFNKKHNNKFTLYITSTFGEEARKSLKALSKNIEFTGNVSDEELAFAYTQADVLFFPSLSEGLGMPVLEAVQYGVPVACSDIPVLSEISKKGFYQFDPTNLEDISTALSDSVDKKGWSSKSKEYEKIKNKNTWVNSAKKLENALGHKATRPIQKSRLNLKLPDPANGTPAGVLGEEIFSGLNNKYQVGVELVGASKVKRASFLKHVAREGFESVNSIIIKNQDSLLSRSKRIRKIKLTIVNGDKKQHILLQARRVFKDKAVQLEGWEFISENGRTINPQDINSLLLFGKI